LELTLKTQPFTIEIGIPSHIDPEKSISTTAEEDVNLSAQPKHPAALADLRISTPSLPSEGGRPAVQPQFSLTPTCPRDGLKQSNELEHGPLAQSGKTGQDVACEVFFLA
jgi:hypothetical protein